MTKVIDKWLLITYPSYHLSNLVKRDSNETSVSGITDTGLDRFYRENVWKTWKKLSD